MIHLRSAGHSTEPAAVPESADAAEPVATGVSQPAISQPGPSLLRTGAGFLLRGSGGVGLLLARSGFALARSGIRSLKANDQQSSLPAAPDQAGRRSRLRVAIGAGLLAAALGGTAAVVRSRRRAVPEPAPEPPRLQPSLNGSAPHRPANAPATP
ncbi:hypothetical protein [Skermania piniformis]|uniref:Uncharacterized protein n=1 Tax=Skermania pinensis TaxID=39122 RepID=A0ABX8SF68_9ACTN|nr:hypothetical protein [Skermania piniformis]QXQ16091.1 hypothetical protein KV203_00210 [Skermania piniformis]